MTKCNNSTQFINRIHFHNIFTLTKMFDK